MKIAVLTSAHPRRRDLALETWASRQASATQAAGAEVRLLGPQRPHAISLRARRRRSSFDLVHAHGAPAAIAAAQAKLSVPTVVSLYGRDLFYARGNSHAGRRVLEDALAGAQLALVGSDGAAAIARMHGAHATRVVHLGAELPVRRGAGAHQEADEDRGRPEQAPRQTSRETNPPTLVTTGRLIARKRHADVLRALAVLSQRHPTLRYLIVGEGPEQVSLEGLSQRLGVADRVEIVGLLPPTEAIAKAWGSTIYVMPSTEEAFGVAYVEAMAGGVPAIGCRGEPGPEEIAAAGDGFVLVPPGDVERLSQRIGELIGDPQRLREVAMHARQTVAAHFTWEQCGQRTLAAYEDAL